MLDSTHIFQGSSSSQEKSLYVTFFCLTTTFLICHSPRILLNINEFVMNQQRELCKDKYQRTFFDPRWVLIGSNMEKILLVFNSSINFVYYCLVGKAFRQHMCRTFFPCW